MPIIENEDGRRWFRCNTLGCMGDKFFPIVTDTKITALMCATCHETKTLI